MAISRKKVSESTSAAQKVEAANNARVAQSAKSMLSAGQEYLKRLAETKLDLANTIDAVGTTLSERFKNLSDVEEAIRLQTELLQTTYGIQAEANTLEDLRREQEILRTQFAEEQAETKKQRQRDEEEYAYSWRIRRQKDDAEWNRVKSDRESALADREAAVKAASEELAVWKQKYEAMPAEIDARVKAEVAVISNSIKHSYDATSKLAAKDAEMNAALSKQTIDAHAKRISELEIQLAEARKALDAANSRVQTIAEKAIEGASKQAPVVVNSGSGDTSRGK